MRPPRPEPLPPAREDLHTLKLSSLTLTETLHAPHLTIPPRLDWAMKRLSESEDSIANVAIAAGFYDQSHFSHQFKQHTGFTPAEFRAALLHELGHLIQGADGAWRLPDDGHDGAQSARNTLLVQRACRVQLESLK